MDNKSMHLNSLPPPILSVTATSSSGNLKDNADIFVDKSICSPVPFIRDKTYPLKYEPSERKENSNMNTLVTQVEKSTGKDVKVNPEKNFCKPDWSQNKCKKEEIDDCNVTDDTSDGTDSSLESDEDYSENNPSSSQKLLKEENMKKSGILETSDGGSGQEEEIKVKRKVGRPPGRTSTVATAGIVGRKSERLKSHTTFCTKKYEAQILKRLTQMLKKDPKDFTVEEITTLKAFPDLVPEAKKRLQKRRVAVERTQEIEDPNDILDIKCSELATAIKEAKYLVIYTGAGISTSALIPDYRGPNGIWTLLQKGQSLDSLTDSPQMVLSTADPTVTHSAIRELHRRGIAKHIVSQNCDGLHLRSGIPKTSLSEVHGNMYIEVCPTCNREYVRNFDVTENTRRFEHRTGRNCYNCGNMLKDTVVHFGERGSLRWPLNWAGAEYHVDKADTILCIGSSLKVLRRYPWLWCMDKPASKRPKLFIVNLQWTPKDQFSTLKINGKCDDVMTRVMQKLEFSIPPYNRTTDTIFSICTPMHPSEVDSKSSKELSFPDTVPLPPKSHDLNNYIRFDPVFRDQNSALSPQENEEESSPEESADQPDGKKKKRKRRVLKGNGNGWLGNAWGVKPKKRKLK